jgi:hypothetical protein
MGSPFTGSKQSCGEPDVLGGPNIGLFMRRGCCCPPSATVYRCLTTDTAPRRYF